MLLAIKLLISAFNGNNFSCWSLKTTLNLSVVELAINSPKIFDIVEEIIKYYDVSEIENIKPEAKSYDNFAKKYNKNVPNKFKVGMQKYIETYLTEYSKALTAREVILSLSLPHKREKQVERLYPEIISNILSYHQNKEKNADIKEDLPKYLRKYTRGGTKTRARSREHCSRTIESAKRNKTRNKK